MRKGQAWIRKLSLYVQEQICCISELYFFLIVTQNITEMKVIGHKRTKHFLKESDCQDKSALEKIDQVFEGGATSQFNFGAEIFKP